MTKSPPTLRRPSLRSDQRGAIAFSGVFMTCVVASMLWYTIGIGNAAVHREQIQDAGDSSSYASAVYQARGMNIVAMGNVVMAAEFAVKLSVDVSSILNKIELGILIAKCVFSWSDCQFIPRSISLNTIIDILKDKLKDMIMNQLSFLSLTQAKLAQMVPFLAQARALKSMLEYKWVTIGDVISLSMVPEGKKLGLPIQEESEEVLCQKAAQVIPIVALKPLLWQQLPPYVAGFVMGITFSVTGAACGGDDTGKTPKKIFDKAKNGDEYFHIYAFGIHLPGKYKRTDPLVDLAAWGKAEIGKAKARLKSRPPEVERCGMSMTEFYYDEAGRWSDYKDEALWNLKWRARIRRYERIPDQIRNMVPLALANILEQGIDDIIH